MQYLNDQYYNMQLFYGFNVKFLAFNSIQLHTNEFCVKLNLLCTTKFHC